MTRFARTACLTASVLALGIGAEPSLAAPAANAAMLGRLTAVENDAEAIAEAEATGSRARAAAARAAATWRTVRAEVAATPANASVPILDSTIAALRSDRDPVALRRDANEVTGALAPLFALAGGRVPVEVHLLDYFGRSIALDAGAADWSRAAADAASLQRNWSVLRPRVLARPRGRAAADAYDAVVRTVANSVAARSTARTLAAAARSGAETDTLELLFGN